MPKTYKAYTVVRDNNADQFAAKVQSHLKAGWLCRGKMKTAVSSGGHYDYLQNMVMPFAPIWPAPTTNKKGGSSV